MSYKIELPKLISDLVDAQNQYNSNEFVKAFASDAIVYDEGKEYHGSSEIKGWNESTNEKYRTTFEPLDFLNDETKSILTVIVSGNFQGSPLPLKYNFTIKDNKITILSINL